MKLLVYLKTAPRSRPELAAKLGLKSKRTGHLSKAIERLRQLALVELTIPDKPQSRHQKLQITSKGRALLSNERKK